MKKTILALTLIASMPATAQVSEFCKSIADMAETIMEKRQDGVKMIDMLNLVKDNKLIETIVLDAYDFPKFSINENKQEMVSDFSDRWLMACIKNEA
ncbi:MAG: hypothetical protein GY712_14060 [Oceanicoccus sp.]|uniref:hypothetical protein n=1 Tax=Oceanicoccus sp. TaxID=2691044 RepID=UPI00262BB8E9|nr:hypothetical protein [Oceanicoccus sp.]MCP3909128.1 hypothetical protein [Oceanicoccus sp.]